MSLAIAGHMPWLPMPTYEPAPESGFTLRVRPIYHRKAADFTGQRRGRLVILERVANIGYRTAWRCRCDCGADLVLEGRSLADRKGCGRACPLRKRSPKERRTW